MRFGAARSVASLECQVERSCSLGPHAFVIFRPASSIYSENRNKILNNLAAIGYLYKIYKNRRRTLESVGRLWRRSAQKQSIWKTPEFVAFDQFGHHSDTRTGVSSAPGRPRPKQNSLQFTVRVRSVRNRMPSRQLFGHRPVVLVKRVRSIHASVPQLLVGVLLVRRSVDVRRAVLLY